jgi:hypothetical protein
MKVGVWCAVSASRVVGPVFFNETMICEKYVHVILGQFFSELPEEDRLYDCFPQDSATAHTACIAMHGLSNVFRDRIISSGIWSACSPELNP